MGRPVLVTSNTKIKELDCSVRIKNVLALNEGVETVGYLCELTLDQVSGFRHFGQKSLYELRVILALSGLYMKGDSQGAIEPYEFASIAKHMGYEMSVIHYGGGQYMAVPNLLKIAPV